MISLIYATELYSHELDYSFSHFFSHLLMFSASSMLDSSAKFLIHRPTYGSGRHTASYANIQGNISWPFTWPEDQLHKTRNQVVLSLTWWIYRWCIYLRDWMHRNCTMWHDVITSTWCHHTTKCEPVTWQTCCWS